MLSSSNTVGNFINALTVSDLSSAQQYIVANKNNPDAFSKPDRNGLIPLIAAVFFGNTDVLANLLMVSGINVNIADADGDTALMAAAKSGNAVMVTTLLAVPGIDLSMHNSARETAYHQAIRCGHAAIAQQIYTAATKIEPNFVKQFETISDEKFLDAVYDNNLVTVQQYIAQNIAQNRGFPNINAVDFEIGRTLLIEVVRRGYTEMVNLLLTIPGIDVNAATEEHDNALMNAALHDHIDIVNTLLAAKNINVNAQDTDGDTALMYAAKEGNTASVVALLDAEGIDLTVRNNKLQTAADQGNENIANLINAAILASQSIRLTTEGDIEFTPTKLSQPNPASLFAPLSTKETGGKPPKQKPY